VVPALYARDQRFVQQESITVVPALDDMSASQNITVTLLHTFVTTYCNRSCALMHLNNSKILESSIIGIRHSSAWPPRYRIPDALTQGRPFIRQSQEPDRGHQVQDREGQGTPGGCTRGRTGTSDDRGSAGATDAWPRQAIR
jgi:hypothetical protein